MTPSYRSDDPTAFDAWLRDALQAEPEPLDDGFSLRVMAALPAAPRSAAHAQVDPWRRQAAALATAAAGIGLGALALFGGAWPLAEQGLAALSLVGLMAWWSLPQSAGGGWR